MEPGNTSCRQGAVVARHPVAARAGADVLRSGGSAFDAAVATGFAIGVVDIGMCGIGGGAFQLVYRTGEGRTGAIDGPVVAPRLATAGCFEVDPAGPRGLYGFPAVRERANEVGHRSVAVPGAVAGLCRTHELFGSRSLPDLMSAAIEAAEHGFEVSWADMGQLAAGWELLARYLATAAVFLPGGRPPSPAFQFPLELDAPGRIHQPALAQTLRAIASEGPEVFYRGRLARAIEDEMVREGGYLRADDLAAYEIEHVAATESTYRDWRLATGPDFVVLETLGMLDRFDLAAIGCQAARSLHLVSEACLQGHADFYRYLARPAEVEIEPLDHLDPVWLDEKAALIDPDRAWPGGRLFPDEPADGRSPLGYGGISSEAGARVGHTTAFSCADGSGNVVSVIMTLGGLFGSGVTVPGTGIILNDQMLGYNAEPGTWTSVGPGARRPIPGWPVIGAGPDGAVFAIGTPGGNRVLCAYVQAISNLIDHRLPIESAVVAPRIDRGSTPIRRQMLLACDELPEQVLADLRAMGHDVVTASRSFHAPGAGPASFGYPVALSVDARGRAAGMTDPPVPGAMVVVDSVH